MLISFPIKVALVDDDVIQTKLMSGLLKEIPEIVVEVFNDPLKAMEAIESGEYRVVVTDLKMEGLGGDEIVSKCDGLRLGLQVFVVTGSDHLMSAIRCFNAGAQRIIRKPVNKKDLVDAIKSSVDHFKAFNDTVRAINVSRRAA